MALGTSLLALTMGWAGYEPNAEQSELVKKVIHHAFSTVPGILWIITAAILLLYRLNKTQYKAIVNDLALRESNKTR